jgi:hypothetical protein
MPPIARINAGRKCTKAAVPEPAREISGHRDKFRVHVAITLSRIAEGSHGLPNLRESRVAVTFDRVPPGHLCHIDRACSCNMCSQAHVTLATLRVSCGAERRL